MIETIGIILEVGTSLLSLKNFFINSKRRKEISEWLYELGSNIEDLAHYFSNNEYPAKTCEIMTRVHQKSEKILSNTIPKENKEEIINLIGSCLNIEKTFYEYIKMEEPDKIECVQELHSIAGSILGIALVLKYQK